MKATTPALIGLASLTLLAAPVLGADAAAKKSDPPGFSALDKDSDGQLTRAEAARNSNLAKRFNEVDGDKDGRLTRGEYLKVMAAKDFRSLRQELADFVEPGSEEKERPGFNELDRDGDGKLSRAEATRNPVLAKRFGETDDDKDGSITRVEYLKTMAAEDWQNARENMAEFIRPDGKPTAGGSSSK
jgi:Ca2+-binding EF-hand superfamily protein